MTSMVVHVDYASNKKPSVIFGFRLWLKRRRGGIDKAGALLGVTTLNIDIPDSKNLICNTQYVTGEQVYIMKIDSKGDPEILVYVQDSGHLRQKGIPKEFDLLNSIWSCS